MDLFCAMGHSHAEIEKDLPQTDPTKLEAQQNVKMSWYAIKH